MHCFDAADQSLHPGATNYSTNNCGLFSTGCTTASDTVEAPLTLLFGLAQPKSPTTPRSQTDS